MDARHNQTRQCAAPADNCDRCGFGTLQRCGREARRLAGAGCRRCACCSPWNPCHPIWRSKLCCHGLTWRAWGNGGAKLDAAVARVCCQVVPLRIQRNVAWRVQLRRAGADDPSGARHRFTDRGPCNAEFCDCHSQRSRTCRLHRWRGPSGNSTRWHQIRQTQKVLNHIPPRFWQ